MNTELSIPLGFTADLQVWSLTAESVETLMVGTPRDRDLAESHFVHVLGQTPQVRELTGTEAAGVAAALATHGPSLQVLGSRAWLALHAPARLKEITDGERERVQGAGPSAWDDDRR